MARHKSTDGNAKDLARDKAARRAHEREREFDLDWTEIWVPGAILGSAPLIDGEGAPEAGEEPDAEAEEPWHTDYATD